MEATLELKWFEAEGDDLKRPCASLGAFYPECGNTYYVLKQKWKNKEGDSEWREIDMEY